MLAPGHAGEARLLQDWALSAGEADRCCLIGPYARRHGIPGISQVCDPWHLVAQAQRIVAGATSEIAGVAAFARAELRIVGDGPWAGVTEPAKAAKLVVHGWQWRDPFTGAACDFSKIVQQLAEWRSLIDSNRATAAVYGVARWKRVTADALLWDGYDGPRHLAARSDATATLPRGSRVGAWKSRTALDLPDQLAHRGIAVSEIEDGFIRSTGLGANCVPPLSIIVDHAGIYFDPSGPSDLEIILAEAEIGPELQRRAAALRARLVAAGIGKYGRAVTAVTVAAPGRRRVLVPGQVADDRSVLSGGAGADNLTLLQRARALEPDAWIIYRPHPDVEAGHRAGHIPEATVRALADEIDRASPIAALIDSVDALHTLTSLAGFEALMRGKAVTTHGVPFYAGWGLTRDLAPVPARRGRSRTLDELVAAALILYPRYLDPVSRLPCSPEILVERLASDRAKVSSPLVILRSLQGRASTWVRRFGGQG
nr:beta-3-deoxy-D-manno-oct-2-ulosonic acid transferase [Novosphingobium piscinae]